MPLLDVLFSAFGAVIVLVVVFAALAFDQPDPTTAYVEVHAKLTTGCSTPAAIHLCFKSGSTTFGHERCGGTLPDDFLYIVSENGYTYLLVPVRDVSNTEVQRISALISPWSKQENCAVEGELRVRRPEEAVLQEFTMKATADFPEYQSVQVSNK